MQAVVFTALVQAPCVSLHQSPNFWYLRKESQVFTVKYLFDAKPPGKGTKFPRLGADPWAVPPAARPGQHALPRASSSSQSHVLGVSTENLSLQFEFS